MYYFQSLSFCWYGREIPLLNFQATLTQFKTITHTSIEKYTKTSERTKTSTSNFLCVDKHIVRSHYTVNWADDRWPTSGSSDFQFFSDSARFFSDISAIVSLKLRVSLFDFLFLTGLACTIFFGRSYVCSIYGRNY